MSTIFKLSKKGKRGVFQKEITPKKHNSLFVSKEELNLPELSEIDVVRHYSNLERKNFSVDHNFYPLGSCTMKYNPKVNEYLAKDSRINNLHPILLNLSKERVKGNIELMANFSYYLAQLTGMDYFSLQPLAGASGELTGMLIVRAYHNYKGNKKKYVIVPDSSHGTNPASAKMAGYEVITIKSDKNGFMSYDDFKEHMSEEVAAIMLTVPNTLGIFNKDLKKITELAHKYDALMYYDGANFNALLGHLRPGDIDFDIVHLNLHKTFATPHGGGGPGSGPVGVKAFLKEFLPEPIFLKDNDEVTIYKPKHSIGKVAAFYGNFDVLIKAYSYILSLGLQGLKRVSEIAVLNANYLKKKLENIIDVPFGNNPCMHETVFSLKRYKEEYNFTALDLAKALIDYEIHPPTIYFPLIVQEAVMVEPTETETKKTLDYFINTIKEIIENVKNGKSYKEAPFTTEFSRFDETLAAKKINVADLND